MTSGTLAVDLRNKFDQWRGRSPDEIVAQASQFLPFWVSLLLAIVIAWYAARLVWLLIPSGPAAVWEPPPAGGARPRVSGADYSALVNAPSIRSGISRTIRPWPKPRVEDAPETRLNLKLRGAIAANQNTMAHAIIADSSGNEKVYFIDDQVPGGREAPPGGAGPGDSKPCRGSWSLCVCLRISLEALPRHRVVRPAPPASPASAR